MSHGSVSGLSLGGHGWGAVSRVIFGSVGVRLLRHTNVSVDIERVRPSFGLELTDRERCNGEAGLLPSSSVRKASVDDVRVLKPPPPTTKTTATTITTATIAATTITTATTAATTTTTTTTTAAAAATRER